MPTILDVDGEKEDITIVKSNEMLDYIATNSNRRQGSTPSMNSVETIDRLFKDAPVMNVIIE